MNQEYSVLMSVYSREKAEYLDQALDSMFAQTLPPDDFVLVCDGPLTDELDRVIQKYEKKFPEILQVIRLERNGGLGNALKAGNQCCRHELVARMDSDDIAAPERCRLQVEYFNSHPDVSLLSGQIAEFGTCRDQVTGIRRVPCDPQEILSFAKRRNPMNHMAVMYKKSAVFLAGDYMELNLGEDYYLWVRMLCQGCVGANLPQILVYARTGEGLYDRRGGFSYAGKMCALQKKFYKLKFISFREYIYNCFIRSAVSILPSFVRERIYKKSLRL